jgi:hypothetical protein
MFAIQHPENYYSYRNTASSELYALANTLENTVLGIDLSNVPEAALKAIIDKMAEAEELYQSRNLTDALAAYQDLEDMILALIEPSHPVGASRAGVSLTRDGALFGPMLSSALEHMNIIAPRVPANVARPRVPPLTTPVDHEWSKLGLTSPKFSSPEAISAASDWQLSMTYGKIGNTKAATYFYQRALKTDKRVVTMLDKGAKQTFMSLTEADTNVQSRPISSNSGIVADIVSQSPSSSTIYRPPVPSSLTVERSLGLLINGKVQTFTWNAGDQPPLQAIKKAKYESRVALKAIERSMTAGDLEKLLATMVTLPDLVINLPHIYYYVIPLGKGDCYHAMGIWNDAKDCYLQAASYMFLNRDVEGRYLWLKLANLCLDLGNTFHANDKKEEALDIYTQIITLGDQVPDSDLYPKANSNSPIQFGADDARIVIENLDSILIGQGTDETRKINPEIIGVIINAKHAIATMDTLGACVPIWNFDYLQSAARYLAQQAIQAERQYISFRDKADNEELTVADLNSAKSAAKAEYEQAKKQTAATIAQRDVYMGEPMEWLGSYHGTLNYLYNHGNVYYYQLVGGKLLKYPLDEYGADSPVSAQPNDSIRISLSTDPTNPSQLIDDPTMPSYLVQSVDSEYVLSITGEQINQLPGPNNVIYDIYRKSTTARRVEAERNWKEHNKQDSVISSAQGAAAWNSAGSFDDASKQSYYYNTVLSSQTSLAYQTDALSNLIDELRAAEAEAVAQLQAAEAQVAAAVAAEAASKARMDKAQEDLNNAEGIGHETHIFTAGVWENISNSMYAIALNYLNWAIEVAQMMQRAYNFENNVQIDAIKDYPHYTAQIVTVTTNVGGTVVQSQELIGTDFNRILTAGDYLLNDIDYFTYYHITNVQHKDVSIKQTISLADNYPYLFETRLRQTGRMEFDTRMEDFDMVHPGTYMQRIESMEVEVVGVLPSTGVHGTITNGGISRYRTPDVENMKYRFQPKETLLLSEYRVRDDSVVFPADPKQLKIFQDAGVASSWTLEIPRATNDLSFDLLADVRLIFYYKAFYDPILATAVNDKLLKINGIHRRLRSIFLRWVFPDAFFHFQDTGKLSFSFNVYDFPYNELNPKITNLAAVIGIAPGIDPSGWKIRLGVPAHPATIAGSPNDKGVLSLGANPSWSPLKAGAAVGDYLFEVRADENPGLVTNNALKLDSIQDLVLILEYEYTPRT